MARNIIRLVVLLLLLGVVAGVSWYWSARPAYVQAAIADVRTATNRVDVMTVEAVSEDGLSAVGREISILSARITAVANERTFWVVGSEGDPLLVVVGQVPDARATATIPTFASGERVSLTGVVRDAAGGKAVNAKEGKALNAKERAELAKTDVYLLASDVRLVR